MTTVPIDRRAGLEPAEFRREYLSGLGRPVIVTGAIEAWPAREKWSFDYLKTTYGDDTVLPAAGLYGGIVKMTKLETYLDGLDSPSETLRGLWIDPKTGLPSDGPAALPTPLYLVDWQGFRRHPELFADVEPLPAFVEDWTTALGPTLRSVFELGSQREYWEVMIGPAGCLSKLHYDYWHTHSWLAQIRGRKRCILFSPDDSPFLYEGTVDPEHPDLGRFGRFDRATAFEGEIGPGDTLFLPSRWWHHVRGLEKSITVVHGFFNETNFANHMACFLRALPNLVSGLEQAPELRDALGVTWTLQERERVAP